VARSARVVEEKFERRELGIFSKAWCKKWVRYNYSLRVKVVGMRPTKDIGAAVGQHT